MQLCDSLSILWHCLSLGSEWKLTFFRASHCWVFQICWHIKYNTFTASSHCLSVSGGTMGDFDFFLLLFSSLVVCPLQWPSITWVIIIVETKGLGSRLLFAADNHSAGGEWPRWLFQVFVLVEREADPLVGLNSPSACVFPGSRQGPPGTWGVTSSCGAPLMVRTEVGWGCWGLPVSSELLRRI